MSKWRYHIRSPIVTSFTSQVDKVKGELTVWSVPSPPSRVCNSNRVTSSFPKMSKYLRLHPPHLLSPYPESYLFITLVSVSPPFTEVPKREEGDIPPESSSRTSPGDGSQSLFLWILKPVISFWRLYTFSYRSDVGRSPWRLVTSTWLKPHPCRQKRVL